MKQLFHPTTLTFISSISFLYNITLSIFFLVTRMTRTQTHLGKKNLTCFMNYIIPAYHGLAIYKLAVINISFIFHIYNINNLLQLLTTDSTIHRYMYHYNAILTVGESSYSNHNQINPSCGFRQLSKSHSDEYISFCR